MDILPHDNVAQFSARRAPERTRSLSAGIPDPDHFVHIPNGKYVAEFVGAQGFYYRGRSPKVALWFSISDGKYKGERVAAYYNVTSLQCRPGQRVQQPSFSVGWRADLTAVLATLFPDRYSHVDLPTVIPESEMEAAKILIQIRTTKKTHKGQMRPEQFHNSVVDLISGWAGDF